MTYHYICKVMGKIIRILNRIPVYALSVACCAAVLVLTLMPGDSVSDVPLFLHADKLAHFVMFGVLAVVFLWDFSRKCKTLSRGGYWCAVAAASVLGGVVELLQQGMGMGRSGDIADWVADIAGAVVMPLLLWRLLKYILSER